MATEKAEILLSAVDKTKPAFEQAKRNMEGLKASSESLVGKFGTLGVAITGAFAGATLKDAIDMGDELSKLSQKTGIAVERLSELKYAGSLADVSIEDLANGVKKLGNNMAAAAGGNKEAGAAFAAIGVKVQASTGALRASDEVLADVAERFASYEDGVEKAALATALFGKNGTALIPFLNSGSAGLREMAAEARELGVVFSEDLAKKSEAFNDNLTRINASAKAAKISLLGELLPALVATSEAFVRNIRAAGLFRGTLITLGEGLVKRMRLDDLSQAEGKMKEAGAAVEALTQRAIELDAALSKSPGDASLKNSYEYVRRRLAEVQKEYAAASESVKDLAAAEAGAAIPAGAPTPQGKAPIIRSPGESDKAAAEALALARKLYDGQVKALQALMADERDLIQFNDQFTSQKYQQGLVSLQSYYDGKLTAQSDYLQRMLQGFDDEQAATLKLEEAAKRFGKPADQQDAANKLEELQRKRDAFLREQAQATQLSALEQEAAFEQVRNSVVDLAASVQELQGKDYAAAVLRIGQQAAAARRTLIQGGASRDDAIAGADQIARLLAGHAALNEQQKQYSDLLGRAQAAEELFLIKAERSGLNRVEIERQLGKQRSDTLGQLDEQIAATEKLIEQSRLLGDGVVDERILAFYDQLRIARERAFDAKDPGLLRFNQLARDGGETIAQAFDDAVFSGGKLRDIINNLDKDLARLVTRDLVIKPLADGATNFIKSLGAGGSGGGAETLLSGIAGKIGSFFGAGGQGEGQGASPVAGASEAFASASQAASSASAVAGLTALAAATSASAASEGVATAAVAAFTAAISAAAAAASAFAASAGAEAGGSAVSSLVAGVLHGGGLAGTAGRVMALPAHAWAGATRYHSGGVAGLAPDEVPAILRRGEEVLTRTDARHRDNGGAQGGGRVVQLQVQVQAAPGMSRQTAQQQGVAAGRAVQRHLSRGG